MVQNRMSSQTLEKDLVHGNGLFEHRQVFSATHAEKCSMIKANFRYSRFQFLFHLFVFLARQGTFTIAQLLQFSTRWIEVGPCRWRWNLSNDGSKSLFISSFGHLRLDRRILHFRCIDRGARWILRVDARHWSPILERWALLSEEDQCTSSYSAAR